MGNAHALRIDTPHDMVMMITRPSVVMADEPAIIGKDSSVAILVTLTKIVHRCVLYPR